MMTIKPKMQMWLGIGLAIVSLYEGFSGALDPQMLGTKPNASGLFYGIPSLIAVPCWLYVAWLGFIRMNHRKGS